MFELGFQFRCPATSYILYFHATKYDACSFTINTLFSNGQYTCPHRPLSLNVFRDRLWKGTYALDDLVLSPLLRAERTSFFCYHSRQISLPLFLSLFVKRPRSYSLGDCFSNSSRYHGCWTTCNFLYMFYLSGGIHTSPPRSLQCGEFSHRLLAFWL